MPQKTNSTSMIRILYVIPRYAPHFISNETHGEIVRELQARGVAVDVLSFTTRNGDGGPAGWSNGFGSERVYRHVQNATLLERTFVPIARHAIHYEYFGSMLAGYLSLLRHHRYDIIHVENTFPLGAIAALAAPVVRTPYIITTTGGDLFRLPGQGYGYGHYLVPRLLMRLALRRAAWVRTNSRLSGRICVRYGANPHRLSPLPVSIGDGCYPPTTMSLSSYRAACRAALIERYGWTDMRDDPTIPLLMCVGRLIAIKSPELLIEALPQINEQVGRVRVCIVGPSRVDSIRGEYLDFLQGVTHQLGVATQCTFPGFVEPSEVKDYLAAADIVVVPSRLEGLNRVVIEAGAVGTPSVVSDGAGAAELVARSGCGLMVPKGSASTLAHGICRLLQTPGALVECGERARLLAAEQSASSVAQALVTLYERVRLDSTAAS